MTNKALTITRDEWKEIMLLPEVDKVFDIKGRESIDDFASRIYGAKYVYDTTDYDGSIYTLVGEYEKGEVLMLERYLGSFRLLK